LSDGLGRTFSTTNGCALSAKRRIVAGMNVKSAMQFIATNQRPTSTAALIGIAETFPRELDSFVFANLFDAAIEPPTHSSELKGTVEVAIEGNVPRHDEIDIVAVPHFHLDDAPLSDEGVIGPRHGWPQCGLTN
jgi:hypothetical protein